MSTSTKLSTKIFAFPYAGGSGFSYWGWKPYVSSELIPLEYAGHGGRANEPLDNSIEEMAEDMCRQIIEDVATSGPAEGFALFGHSMGGIVAFVTAQYLIQKGYEPSCLVLSCSSCPSDLNHQPSSINPQSFIPASIMEHDGSSMEQMETLSFRHRFLPVLRHDIALSRQIDVWQVLDVPTILIHATADRIVSKDSAMRWQGLCKVQQYVEVPGGHFYFEYQEGLDRLLEILNSLR